MDLLLLLVEDLIIWAYVDACGTWYEHSTTVEQSLHDAAEEGYLSHMIYLPASSSQTRPLISKGCELVIKEWDGAAFQRTLKKDYSVYVFMYAPDSGTVMDFNLSVLLQHQRQ